MTISFAFVSLSLFKPCAVVILMSSTDLFRKKLKIKTKADFHNVTKVNVEMVV